MTRIAIPSDDRQTVAQHFGRAAGFLVFQYDGGALTSNYRPLTEGMAHDHERIVDAIRDCDVVIAGGMGGGMMSALYAAGIEVAISTVEDARKAAEMLVDDILPVSSGSGCCTN